MIFRAAESQKQKVVSQVSRHVFGEIRKTTHRHTHREREKRRIKNITHIPRIPRTSPSHEIDDLLAVQVDDAKGFVGAEVEGVAVGWGDYVCGVGFWGGCGGGEEG